MFGHRIRLFKLLGFEVRIDLSWIVIAVLIVWSLGFGLFPAQYRGLSMGTYVLMAIAGTIGLFLSIVLHELSHSLVARGHGMQMKGITLFIFGGVAEMGDEPPHAGDEFLMAIAGPLMSVVIGGVSYGISYAGFRGGWPVPVTGVFRYLAWINWTLAVFNLLPAFPLDGGRVLRSILWRAKGNLRWATRVSSQIGEGFGILLIIAGAVSFVTGHFLSGVWWFLIGMFLRNAASMSYQQLVTRKALEGEPISRFMRPDPVTVPADVTVDQLVSDYVYKYHFKLYPVIADRSKLIGCVLMDRIKDVPREAWAQTQVGAIAEPCTPENTVPPDVDAVKALALMNRTGVSRLLVTDRPGHLVGVVTLKDMLKLLSLKVELET